MMKVSAHFPSLERGGSTRDTLSLYAQVVGVVPRALAEPHLKWWHISLKVTPAGLVTDEIPLPDGDGAFQLRMNRHSHHVELLKGDFVAAAFDMSQALPATEFGAEVLAGLAEHGIEGDYETEKFDDSDPRTYDRAESADYFAALLEIDRVLKAHKAGIEGETGPVQLWPHHFDIAFEWYGTRMIPHEEQGETQAFPSQINFGFSPGDGSHPAPYFYSNPWPFEQDLIQHELPSGARWFTESWEGTLLPYQKLVGVEGAADLLLAYYQAVYELASPRLVA